MVIKPAPLKDKGQDIDKFNIWYSEKDVAAAVAWLKEIMMEDFDWVNDYKKICGRIDAAFPDVSEVKE